MQPAKVRLRPVSGYSESLDAMDDVGFTTVEIMSCETQGLSMGVITPDVLELLASRGP